MSAVGNPIWLSILMSKYEMNKLNRKDENLEHYEAVDGDLVSRKKGSSVPINVAKGMDAIVYTASDSTKMPIFTIGKFSAFLSCCAVGLIPCKSQELDAFTVVSQIEILHKSSFQPFKARVESDLVMGVI